MPFTLPTFNLSCKVTHGGGANFTTVCNLTFNPRNRYVVPTVDLASAPPQVAMLVYILLPAGTDIRGAMEAGGNRDQIEVVVGSGRIYWVWYVDDSGKGFANEHRVAVCYQKQSFGVPIP